MCCQISPPARTVCAEIFDPRNRRYGYPFTNCTNCGPRYSIIEALPYDRASTTMRRFTMCPACQAEYDDPLNRRFQAQPNACPRCGPQLAFWDAEGRQLHERAVGEHTVSPLHRAAEAIRQGEIVAVKGLGGFHLIVDARSHAAVQRLRQRKAREEKPFALMYPSLARIRRRLRGLRARGAAAALARGADRPAAAPTAGRGEQPDRRWRRARQPEPGRDAAPTRRCTTC